MTSLTSSSLLPPLLRQQRVDQIGIVVPNLEEALPFYAGMFAAEAWNIYTYDESIVPFREFRGAAGQFTMKLALGGKHPQIELIEALEGPSLYHEWIAQRGYGLHHLGIFVSSIREVVADMQRHDLPVLQQGGGYGLDGDGGFAYFDTINAAHTYIEAIEVPRRRRPPEREYVPPGLHL